MTGGPWQQPYTPPARGSNSPLQALLVVGIFGTIFGVMLTLSMLDDEPKVGLLGLVLAAIGGMALVAYLAVSALRR